MDHKQHIATCKRFYAEGGYAKPTGKSSRLKNVQQALYASQYYADGGPVYTPPENLAKPTKLELGYASQYFADGGAVDTIDPTSLQEMARAIGEKYPRLKSTMDTARLQWAPEEKGAGRGHLEFFHPWDIDNPHPKEATFEMYDPSMKGNDLQDYIAADALHHLGSRNPFTMQDVDPAWRAQKKEFMNSYTPDQNRMNMAEYYRENSGIDGTTVDDYMDQNRTDAYLRGALFPSVNPEWQEPGFYTPEQLEMLGHMKTALQQTYANGGAVKRTRSR